MDHIQLYWKCSEDGTGQTSSLFLSVFSSLGLCHSLRIIVFHSLGVEFPCTEGTLMNTFLSHSFPVFFQRVWWAGLLEKDVVVWWFIKGFSSSILIYVTPFYYFFNLQNHYYFFSLQMWWSEGFLALQGETAPPYGLFFRHFIHICKGKTFKTFDFFFIYIVVILHINFTVFLLLILYGDVELHPAGLCPWSSNVYSVHWYTCFSSGSSWS